MKEPNRLINAASPYLLQHAYNPVQWYPWGEEALRKAREENKLIIVSIGYSACHWCHVMEQESFEDEEVATVMNKSFVCIKVDREERPDIDQVYMDALQLMTGRGGWPLNIIALPDQRPVYGGTYFPKEQWRQVLLQLAALYRNDPDKCREYGDELAAEISRLAGLAPGGNTSDRSFPDHGELMLRWSAQFDREEGGMLRAPKFPMADTYRYLLAAASVMGNSDVLGFVELTLKKIAYGGINDQVGGGFARYSTDLYWKVPHFEKMLYDNALLVSLYADAFKRTGNALYKEVMGRTLGFVSREMTSPAGGFYSALDADSEGVEGKFYCWSPEEVMEVAGADYRLALDYFNVNERGFWEHANYIPLRHFNDDELAVKYGMGITEFQQKVDMIRDKLFRTRARRVPPGLDDKMICSWNALMLSAWLDAYTATGENSYLHQALKTAAFMRKAFFQDDYHLFHSVKESDSGYRQSVNGFLEDYAMTIEALINLHSVTMQEEYYTDALRLTALVNDEFLDEESALYWFTSRKAEKLITRKYELQDNVIPSSNAVMSHNLLRLSVLSGNVSWENQCRKMLVRMKEEVVKATPWHSRWARVFLELEHGNELVICGEGAGLKLKDIHSHYLPLSLIAASERFSEIEIFKNRCTGKPALIYVCRNRTCHPPVNSVAEALALLT